MGADFAMLEMVLLMLGLAFLLSPWFLLAAGFVVFVHFAAS